ncbi:hypothetical protein C8F04DRAFT_1139468, partial [Mycena alexandri]
MTVAALQSIVNRVYKQGLVEGKLVLTHHKVTEDGPWWGLAGYRSTDWRSALPAQAHKAVVSLFETQQGSESESDEEAETSNAGAGDTTSTPVPSAADASVKPKAFNFKTPAGIEEFIAWTLQKHAGGTMAFHWKQWGDGIEKKGLFLSYLIVYTYAHHVAILKSMPPEYTRSELPPYGALLLSVQAVERELGFWKTGTYILPKGPSSQFSFDNWGDIRARDASDRKKNQSHTPRNETWKVEDWAELEVEAEQWLEVKKRFASSSRATSEAGDIEVLVEDEDE